MQIGESTAAAAHHLELAMSVPESLTVTTASLTETDRLAAALASQLRSGDVLALHGHLGAGKTRFVQGLASALDCDADAVRSPTFILVQEYDGRLPLYHCDAYRLRDADEFLDLGGEELFTEEGVVCIEWAERIATVLPRDILNVRLKSIGETSREFEFTATGPRGQQLIEALRQPPSPTPPGQ